MYRKLFWIAAAALALAPVRADASALAFGFETSDAVFAVSAGLTASDTLNSLGGYDVTGISGTVIGPGGGTISGLANGARGKDDGAAFSTSPYFDNSGILFAAGAYDDNIHSALRGVSWIYPLWSNNPAGSHNPGHADGALVAGLPEPASWLMLGLGLAGLWMAGRRTPRRDRYAAFA